MSPGIRQQADGAQQQDNLQTVSHRDSWTHAERQNLISVCSGFSSFPVN